MAVPLLATNSVTTPFVPTAMRPPILPMMVVEAGSGAEGGGVPPLWMAALMARENGRGKGLPAVAQQSTPGCRQAANEPGGAGTRWARVCCQQQSRVPGTSLRF